MEIHNIYEGHSTPNMTNDTRHRSDPNDKRNYQNEEMLLWLSRYDYNTDNMT